MPNNITNKIEFSGKPENIKNVLDLIKSENRAIDFNRIIPMPASLMIPSGSDEEWAIKYALSKKDNEERTKIKHALKNTKCRFYGNYYEKIFMYIREDENETLDKRAVEFALHLEKNDNPFDNYDYVGLGIKNFEDLGNTYINNIIKYGCSSWYDWSCDAWGTKWNAYDVYVDDSTIEFDTAWSCPIPVLDALAKLCYEHEVWFTGKWADEDRGHNVGVFESDCDDDEYWFSYEYVENQSDEAYEIYIELKGESNCIGKDADGNWVHYDCENCPNANIC